ncbi:protein kintoun [Taeniopygia guttata]|uniref:protein kintoun n=1 Tax=Taeniopygia guttata TaxID=59729 RepID=UPI003BB92204
MAGAGRLQDLDLSAEEAERLKRAFRDEQFRALFAEYAAELTDPEQRRLYEEEVAALERERGMEVRFVHPTPGFVLRTSQDGSRRCYINVCSNALMGEPRARAERGGQRWELPYSLAPGREELRPGGRRRLLYDVVFHPAALRLAARSARFRRLLRDTALEAVESRCGVRLDRNNATVLRGVSYKGVPQAPVIRSPLPGGAPKPPDDGESPLPPFPFPFPSPPAAAPPPAAGSSPAAPPPPSGPTTPRWSIRHRSYVDLQDYRHSRDSAPSPVPRELVVTVELPLLRSAEQAELEIRGRELRLDSRCPAYRLRLRLPYDVDESGGRAAFNRAQRQLQVTLPVVLPPGPSGERLEGAEPAAAGLARAGPAEAGGGAAPPPELGPGGAARSTCGGGEPGDPLAEPPADPLGDPPAGPAAEPLAEPPAEPPVEPLCDAPAEPHVYPTSEPFADSPPEPPVYPTSEPFADSPPEPPAEPATDPSSEPFAEPATDPTSEPATDPGCEPFAELTTDPTSEPATDLNSECPAELATDPSSERFADSPPEPPAEPATDPGSEPFAEPTTDPTSEPATDPSSEPFAEFATDPTSEPATDPGSEPFAEPTTDPTSEPATDPSSEPPAGPTTDPCSEPFTEPPATDPPAEPEPPTEPPEPALPCSGAASPIASPDPAMPTGDTPLQASEGHPSEVATCPPFRARQDEASLTLLLLVPGIQPRSLRGDVGTHHYSLRFRTASAAFALFLRFPAALLRPESSVSVSAHNAVVGLAKAPGSTGLWDKFSFGLHPSALQERLFVSEENVDGFLGTAFCPSPCSQSALESQPLIEVLGVTEDRIQIKVEPQERDGAGTFGSSGGALAGNIDSDYPETKAATECPAAEGGAAGSSPAPTAGTMGKAGCASHHCLQHEPPATSSAIPGGSGRTEPDLESAAAAGDTAPAPGSGKAGKLQGDGDGDGDEEAAPGLGSRAGSPILREVNPEDGSVRILRDHRTRCPVEFHSPLLFQLD